MDSRDPHRSAGEKEALYQKSEKLRKKFEQLADQTEGKAQRRQSSKGAAYSLAEFYLNKYPAGSVTVTKGEVPSLIKFSRDSEDENIVTPSGQLEIGTCSNDYVELAMNGNAMKKIQLSAIKTAFQRAKRAIKQKNMIKQGSTTLI
jgi:hypothetical protein